MIHIATERGTALGDFLSREIVGPFVDCCVRTRQPAVGFRITRAMREIIGAIGDGQATVAELREVTGRSPSAVNDLVARMTANGVLTRVDRGVYEVAA